ncbi:MAG TPA: acyltransferase family protein [Acidimicrobiales bacterium]|nr:acyltransferase family protein [Acidimicrobiales bacterium]
MNRSTLRADIQGLRALAASLVVAAHVFGVPAGGFVGVDVFFVISGFLITGLLLREKDITGRVSLRNFYLRRARRILPVALIVLVATNVAARAIFIGARVHQTFVDSLWAFVFAGNLHFAQLGTSYFDAQRPHSALLHFWSLAVEEQFYVVWPCLLLLALVVTRRRAPVVVGVVASVVIVCSFAFALQKTASNAAASYFLPTTRAWELALGALTATVVASRRRVAASVAAPMAWIGLGVIVVSAFVIDASTPFPGLATVAPVVATAVVLGVGDVANGLGARWAFGARPWQFLGGASYSLYLWHWPALIFAEAYYGKGTATARAVALSAGLGLTAFTYLLVERPVHVARHIRPLVLAPTALALSATTVLMAGTAVPLTPAVAHIAASTALGPPPTTTTSTTTERAPATAPATTQTTRRVARTTTTAPPDDAAVLRDLVRVSTQATTWGPLDPSLDSLPNAGAPEWIVDKCLNVDAANKSKCVYGNPQARHLAMLLGDSIAVSYLPGLRNALPPDWEIQVLTMSLCPMVDAPTRQYMNSQSADTRCAEHQQWVHEQVEAARPDLIIMANAISSANRLVDHGEKDSADNASRWHDAFDRELARLSPLTYRIVVMGSPTGTGNLQECATSNSTPRDCAIDLYPFWGMIRDAERSAAADHGATYIDPLGWICYDGVCPAVIGTTPVNWDGNHFTAAFSRRLAPVLAPYFKG